MVTTIVNEEEGNGEDYESIITRGRMTGAEGRENKSTTALVTYTNEPTLA